MQTRKTLLRKMKDVKKVRDMKPKPIQRRKRKRNPASTKSRYEGLYVVAKFFLSKAPDGKLNCISRTLGKFSILNTCDEDRVDDQDVWVCKILRELKPNAKGGAFVLKPLEKIDADKRIRKIIPGFYDVREDYGAVLLLPNTDPADYWILSKGTREIFSKKYHTVIVPITYSEELAAKARNASEDAVGEAL